MNTTNETIIEVDNLTKSFLIKENSNNFIEKVFFPKFKKFKAVDNLNFSVKKGEI